MTALPDNGASEDPSTVSLRIVRSSLSTYFKGNAAHAHFQRDPRSDPEDLGLDA
jgi:hypothetical protein